MGNPLPFTDHRISYELVHELEISVIQPLTKSKYDGTGLFESEGILKQFGL